MEFHSSAYHILPADLRDLASVESQLSSAGIDFNAPTLFLSECVLIYMEHEFSNDVIRFAAKKFSTSVFVTYEQIRPNTRFGSVMVDNIRRRGCPMFAEHTRVSKLCIPEATVRNTRILQRKCSRHEPSVLRVSGCKRCLSHTAA